MYRSWLEQERLGAMFDQLKFKPKALTTELLDAAEAARVEASTHLIQSFENMVRKCFPNMIGSILPINPEHALEQPDVSLFFKPTGVPRGHEWLGGMELQAKVLRRDESEDYFQKSHEYLRQKEMVIVIPMSRNIPSSIFKPKFMIEIDRIGNILQNRG